jgi:hypothetical protein
MKGVSMKRRFVFTASELQRLTDAGRAFPVGKRINKHTVVDHWVTTGTAQNEDWSPEDLRVVELMDVQGLIPQG